MTTTTSHRLFVSRDRWARLRALPEHPLLRRAAAYVADKADAYAADRAITIDQTGHNWHLIRARQAQTRVVTLLVRYGMTGDLRYRDAAVAYLRDMAGWEYWSWIKWREGISDPDAIFDLSYGENATTLALAYDWLAEELSDDERALIVETARVRALRPYLARNGTAGAEMWYYRSKDCNWNTVCNGGAGMLALALGELAPESGGIVELAEEGVRHYFEFLEEDGAWPEGIGYWGYGHRYGYMYLLSHERATGRPHPLLARPGSRNTLRFPFLFSPNGVPASFGDVNSFFPLPFIYAAADRFAMPDILAEMDRRVAALPPAREEGWPNTAELLLHHPGVTPEVVEYPWPRVSVQKGLEWGYLADRWPNPALYCAVRGGTSDAPHTHQDLTTVTVIVGREALIETLSGDYIDTTFSNRRFELYEIGAWAKNVMLVNGVGLPHPATVSAAEIHGDGWDGIFLDATDAANVGTPVRFYGRAVLMLTGQALLILDRARIKHTGLGEVRFHTRAAARFYTASARLTRNDASLHLAFAANVPCRLTESRGMPTTVTRDADTILRWGTVGKHTDLIFATLLTPNGTGRVKLNADTRTITARGPGFAVSLRYSEEGLELE